MIGDGAVYYCMGIYKDIDKYEQNPILFSKNHDIQDFLYLSELVMKCSQKLVLRKVHFDCVKEILSPDEELDFNWTIDKSKEGVKNCIDAKFSNEFLNELKSKFYKLFIPYFYNIYKTNGYYFYILDVDKY